jgi:hypothetical protein
MRPSSGVSVTSAWGVCWRPCGRPGRRVAVDGCCGFAVALAVLATCSAALRTLCWTRSGNERRSCVLTSDQVHKDSPGTGVPDRLEKNRSSP